MAKKIFLGALILFLSASIFSAASAKKIPDTWRLDGLSSDGLRNFRLMTDEWQNPLRGKEPTRRGMENLHVSASAQPSTVALAELYEKLHALEPAAKIFLIDLRQESHGFANSLPVSWYAEHNAANADKNTSAVLADEIARLKKLRGVDTTFEPLGNADKQRLKPITIIPRVVQTERDAAEKLGFEYVRFAAADMQFPAPEIVDDFIIFVANLPENSWLHFHCQAGHGRTTTFLAMYDIMKNPDVSLEEICKRQYLLGGSNLLLEPEGNDWYAKKSRDRAKKIRLFYEFVQGTRAEKIGLPWSEWLREIDR
ncbi:MAG: protein tyrosine phosphatase [Selenomonadaceae bacterium]|nr:protein tyrosine phosphatase [Selenomonadaceae bacterium]MBQ9496444.1 protein tyrosine phosphatase [Selenomonadaceae bacterium]